MSASNRELIEALERKERSLREKIAERRDALDLEARPPDPAGDDADKALGRVRAEIEQDLIEIALRELAEIGAVRERVANGTYGECVECGESIAPARLEVNPAALRCAPCQARHEKWGGAR
jgi:DnaK suppressor protein